MEAEGLTVGRPGGPPLALHFSSDRQGWESTYPCVNGGSEASVAVRKFQAQSAVGHHYVLGGFSSRPLAPGIMTHETHWILYEHLGHIAWFFFFY